MSKRLLTSLALVAVAALAGCASPARVEQMRVDAPLSTRTTVQASPLRANVAVKEVTGGKETNPMWMSNVSSAEFERALEDSLRAAGLLSAGRQSGTHVLTADLVKLDQPLVGFSMTVTASVRYALVERASNREVFTRTIATPFTAELSSSFIGSERLRLANEGAVRENLKRIVEDLAALPAGSLSLR